MDFYVQKLKNQFHLLKAILANTYYGAPSNRLTVIGVTGTDGKTTTSSLIYHILKSAGKKVSVITTVSAVIGGKSYDTGFHTTTPSPFTVQKFLHDAVKEGDEYFVLETTSHALDQYRVYGVDFTYGVITNVTHEHLQYHKTYENYVHAKAKLLKWAKHAFINRDDRSYEILAGIVDQSKTKTYGLLEKSDYQFDISEKIGKPLAHFNLYNFLAAYAVCSSIGLAEDVIFNAMKSYVLPEGRMEVVYDGDFKVIVDFAHTPNALHEALPSVRAECVKKGRLIHIFGAAAFRDDAKRPLMGQESGKYADLTIITEEDYRTEDPEKIAREIAVGLKKEGFTVVKSEEFGKQVKTYTSIVNRKDAIKRALDIARSGDVIVLTGKGHERSLCRGTVEYPWHDKEAVLDLVKKI
ncbi:UDP-N-acetylmuramoyl-L-alanyl-D-glutamate--2,6-diaminopimelate ligase [Candidatus Roizmanbacteria bacterium]|nr:MAG: UDP-N-acetylmuramoyl-L-alanyl-D-glutamate--2,6-diaminopimelate ligase [Candidatus Roizmanbacteria bacterium]